MPSLLNDAPEQHRLIQALHRAQDAPPRWLAQPPAQSRSLVLDLGCCRAHLLGGAHLVVLGLEDVEQRRGRARGGVE